MESTAFRALSDVVLAIAAEREVEPVLQRLVHSARDWRRALRRARDPGRRGRFASFITSGMSDELIAAMGPLPRTHGCSARCSSRRNPTGTDDIRADPRFRGWWPSAHPQMRSFLGVPIVARGEVIGALYLTDQEDGRRLLGRRPAADRAARRARRARDRERAPARAQPRAEHRRGAQPARARAARLGHPEAVRGRARGRVGVDAARRATRGAAGERSRGVASWPGGRWRSCARWSSSCAPPRSRPKGWRPRCASTSTCCGASTGRRSSCGSCAVPRRAPERDAGAADRPGGARQRAAPRGRRRDRAAPEAATAR